MPQLFVTDIAALQRPLIIDGREECLSRDAIASAMRCGLVDGMPFILSDDGEYRHDINRFLRECPTMGVRSRNSLLSYARDILTWIRFLSAQRNKVAWEADRQDVIAFHRARRQGAHARISASSWNRSVAALEKLYRWAALEELIEVSPFAYCQAVRRDRHPRQWTNVAVVGAYERAARRSDMQFIDLERFLQFRDVGLRGRMPNGLEDESWRGRNGSRNALFAELLVTTGLRVEEAGSLLITELPRADKLARAGTKTIPFQIPNAIAKGGRGREIRLPVRILRRMWEYIDLERANILTRRSAESVGDDIIKVVSYSGDKFELLEDQGEPRGLRMDRFAPVERRRLRMVRDGLPEPLVLWLTESGEPVPTNTWEAIFRRAGERCQSVGFDVTATPHMLRHTFAVHMLSMLIREQIGSVFGDGQMPGFGAAYRRVLGDPLQKVQRLLGHASITSTYIYLDSLEEARELVDAAAERLVDGLESRESP